MKVTQWKEGKEERKKNVRKRNELNRILKMSEQGRKKRE